jgi:uncharacterized protein
VKKIIHQNTHGERAVPGGREVTLDFRVDGTPAVPATLMIPASDTPVAGVLLIHGYSSRKEHMSENVGRVLLQHGLASLSIDLPLHGTRSDPLQFQALRNPLRLMEQWRLATRETRLAARFLTARPEIDAGRTAVVGYSLGSYLAALLAAEDRNLRALVIAAGGDLPEGMPLTTVARAVADPLRAVERLNGRPLLVVHGKGDRTVRPDQAQRLFDAAPEPKEIRWWDSGHYLPAAAIHDAATWLTRHLD